MSKEQFNGVDEQNKKGTSNDINFVSKKPWWKKIFEYKNYCIIMVILVILALVIANVGKMFEKKQTVDLGEYINYEETELIDLMGYSKNDYGCYPDESNIMFICVDGKVSAIRLSSGQKDVEDMVLCGLHIGDNMESVESQILEKYVLESESEIVGGIRKVYINNENGYNLSVDCDTTNKVLGIAYSSESAVQTDVDIDDNTEIQIDEQRTMSSEELYEEISAYNDCMCYTSWSDEYEETVVIAEYKDELVMALKYVSFDEDGNIFGETYEAYTLFENFEDEFEMYTYEDDVYTKMYLWFEDYGDYTTLVIYDEFIDETYEYLEAEYAYANVG